MTGKASAVCRRAAHHVATLAAGIPEYSSDLAPIRGKCLGRRCRSRWAVVRVSLDFRDPARVDRLATAECAVCGRVWRRVREPRITSAAGYQTVRLTLILPASYRRWYNRKRWQREGDDAIIVRDGNIGDLDEAARAHRRRADALATRKANLRARAERAELATYADTMAWIARMAATDAANAAEEQAAAAREAAYR